MSGAGSSGEESNNGNTCNNSSSSSGTNDLYSVLSTSVTSLFASAARGDDQNQDQDLPVTTTSTAAAAQAGDSDSSSSSSRDNPATTSSKPLHSFLASSLPSLSLFRPDPDSTTASTSNSINNNAPPQPPPSDLNHASWPGLIDFSAHAQAHAHAPPRPPPPNPIVNSGSATPRHANFSPHRNDVQNLLTEAEKHFFNQVLIERRKMAEEIKLLKSMLRERDERIVKLSADIASLRDDVENVHIQTVEAHRLLEEDAQLHKQKLAKYEMEEKETSQSMTLLQNEMKNSATLYEYVQLLKDAAAQSSSVQDSSYILRLQSQLMKAMHQMGMTDNQINLYENQCSSMAKSLRDEITALVDERCVKEVQLMNELGMLHGEMKDMEDEYSKKIEERRRQLEEVEEALAEYEGASSGVGEGSGTTSSDDDDESSANQEDTTGSEQDDDAEGDNDEALDDEIERLSKEVEALATEKESMEQHLRMEIAEKDDVLAQLKEETEEV